MSEIDDWVAADQYSDIPPTLPGDFSFYEWATDRGR